LTARQASSAGGYAYIYVNETEIAYSTQSDNHNNSGHVAVSVTIKLQRDDKVKAKFNGSLSNFSESKTTYFEGRLISKLESPEARMPVYGRYG